MNNCPECGFENEDSAETCASCGYPLKNDNAAEHQTNRKNKIIGFILIAAACICLTVGIITLGEYKSAHSVIIDDRKNDYYLDFWKQHYQECKAGYEENIASAKAYYGSGFFYSSYMGIADDYLEMMQDDLDRIDEINTEYDAKLAKARKIQTKGIIISSFSVPLVVAGILFIFRKGNERWR